MKKALLFRTNNQTDPNADVKINNLENHLIGNGWSVDKYLDCTAGDIDAAIRGLEQRPPINYQNILIYLDDLISLISGNICYTSGGGNSLKIEAISSFVESHIRFTGLTWISSGQRSGLVHVHDLISLGPKILSICSMSDTENVTPDGFDINNNLVGDDFLQAAISEKNRLAGTQSVQILDHGITR